MQSAFQSVCSHACILGQIVLQRVRLASPLARPAIFSARTAICSHHAPFSTGRLEEHGFEQTTISDILKEKGKSADGSWLWCTTEDTVYEAVKSVRAICICLFTFFVILVWK